MQGSTAQDSRPPRVMVELHHPNNIKFVDFENELVEGDRYDDTLDAEDGPLAESYLGFMERPSYIASA